MSGVICHGVDLVQIERIERIWRDHAERFLSRIYTAGEQSYCLASRTPEIRLSGRFAVKEAVLKALGTGWRGGIEWTDIETLPDALGKPVCTLSGQVREIASNLGVGRMIVSISHAGEYAMASAIGVRLDP